MGFTPASQICCSDGKRCEHRDDNACKAQTWLWVECANEELAQTRKARADMADEISLLAHNLETTVSVHKASIQPHIESAKKIAAEGRD